jgi:hypothetical protein
LVESKKIEVNGTCIPVEVYLGGDYKVCTFLNISTDHTLCISVGITLEILQRYICEL